METKIKELSINLGTSGSYNGANKTLGTLQTIFNEPSMSYRSGKIVDLTVIVSGSNNAMDMDLLFFPQSVTVASNQNATFSMSLSDLQSCSGRIRVSANDFSQIGGCTIANLYNVNMTFETNKLFVTSVYQQSSGISLPATGGIYLNVGYELGQSSIL